jgi:hypothetical protein
MQKLPVKTRLGSEGSGFHDLDSTGPYVCQNLSRVKGVYLQQCDINYASESPRAFPLGFDSRGGNFLLCSEMNYIRSTRWPYLFAQSPSHHSEH